MHTHLSVVLALFSLAACTAEGEPAPEPNPVDCTDDERASVVLTVEETGGSPIAGASVAYLLDGDEPAVPCEAGDTDGAYVCGYEVEGELTLLVAADGFVGSAQQVTVAHDGCHVVTEEVVAVLEIDEPPTEPCSEPLPAAAVWVYSESGAPLSGVQVTYSIGGGEDADCTYLNLLDYWECAYDVLETFEVTASADGHEPRATEVEVTSDDCGPIAAEVVLTLTPSL